MINRMLLSTLVVVLTNSALAQNPSTENPQAALAVRPENADLVKQAHETYQALRASVDKLTKLSPAGQQKANPATVGKAHVDALRLERLAQRLLLAGEPAGRDFSLRRARLRLQLENVVREIKKVHGDQINRDFPKLQQLANKKRNLLTKVRKTAEQGMWEEAETMFYEIFDDIEMYAFWYDFEKRKQALTPFLEPEKTIRDRLTADRRQKTIATIEAELNKPAPGEAVVAALTAAKNSIAATGTAAVDGKMLSGPELLQHAGEQWQAVKKQTLRRQALTWSLQLCDPNRSVDLQKHRGEYDAFLGKTHTLLPQMISADVARASATEAQALYPKYVQASAELALQAGNDKVRDLLNPPLAQLAAKAGLQDLPTYQQITGDLLRWRERMAQEAAGAQKSAAPQLNRHFFQHAMATANEPGFFASGSSPEQPTMLAALPPTIEAVQPKATGKPVVCGPAFPANENATSYASAYARRSYATYAAPSVNVAARADALEAELGLVAGTAPLTLDTAAAVTAAQQGHCVEVGGTVTGFTVEALVSHFAVAKEVSRQPVLLGELPQETAMGRFDSQVILRATLKPTWLQYRYFFVKLP